MLDGACRQRHGSVEESLHQIDAPPWRVGFLLPESAVGRARWQAEAAVGAGVEEFLLDQTRLPIEQTALAGREREPREDAASARSRRLRVRPRTRRGDALQRPSVCEMRGSEPSRKDARGIEGDAHTLGERAPGWIRLGFDERLAGAHEHRTVESCERSASAGPRLEREHLVPGLPFVAANELAGSVELLRD